MWEWGFANGECTEFIYGGCDGNDNRFHTKEECEAFCLKKSSTAWLDYSWSDLEFLMIMQRLYLIIKTNDKNETTIFSDLNHGEKHQRLEWSSNI